MVRTGALRGDLDGDGHTDLVSLVARYASRSGCRFALRVRLGTGIVLVRPLPDPLRDESAAQVRGLTWPRLLALVKVNPRPGLQPIVSVALGASIVFVGVFAIHGGRLVRLEAPPSAFAGGASGVASAVDCWHGAGSGEVVSSFAQSHIHGWVVSRSFYRLVGDSFRPLTRATRPIRVANLGALPEFRGGPLSIFSNCTVARVLHL